jgi:hypothetical protein
MKLKISSSSTNVNLGCTNLTSTSILASLFTTPLVPVLGNFVQTYAKPPSSETPTSTELYFYGTIYPQISNPLLQLLYLNPNYIYFTQTS